MNSKTDLEFCVFKIGSQRYGEYRFIIAPRNLEDEISENLPSGYFIDSYSTLGGVFGGSVEIRFGNEFLNDFLCNTVEETSNWHREKLQSIFSETLARLLAKNPHCELFD